MLEQEIKNLGLSEKEVAIYLASLELGPATIQEISQKSGIVRTTAYNAIKSLKEKGLMVEIYKGKRRVFVGESPDRLLSLVRIQKKELEEKERSLQKILPELKGLIDLSRGRPKIRFFEGKEGIRLMQKDILNSKGLNCIEEFIPIDEAYRLFPPHRRDHRHRMLKAFNHTERRVIYTSKRGLTLPSKERLVERMLIPLAKFPLSSEINVYGNKVGIVMFRRKALGVIIQAEEIAESIRSVFYLIWRKTL